MSDLPPEERDEEPKTEADNAAEPAAVKRRRVRSKVRDEESSRWWRAVFSTEMGRREMWGLLQAAHTFEERFACGPNGFPQDLATWHHAGERDYGLRLWRSWLKMAPEGVLLMMAENDPAMAAKTVKTAKEGN